MATAAKGKIALGLMMGFDVELHKATEDGGKVDMDSLCDAGHKPKQVIQCEPCKASWTSWQGVPKRGYPKAPSDGKYLVVLSTEEIKALKAGKKRDAFEIEKLVSLEALAVQYGFGSSYYVLPGEERLRKFLAIPKVVFRFKTLVKDTEHKGRMVKANVAAFMELADRLGIPRMRVLETPLRLGGARSYRTETPLEANGWNPASFLRCNSECHECPLTKLGGENRVLGCAVTPRILTHLTQVGNVASTRISAVEPLGEIPWTRLVVEAWKALGGTAALADLYAGVVAREPRLARHGYVGPKVRAVVQRLGEPVSRGVWRLKEHVLSVPVFVEPAAVAVVEAESA